MTWRSVAEKTKEWIIIDFASSMNLEMSIITEARPFHHLHTLSKQL